MFRVPDGLLSEVLQLLHRIADALERIADAMDDDAS